MARTARYKGKEVTIKDGDIVHATYTCSGSREGVWYPVERTNKGDDYFRLCGTQCDCGLGWEIVSRRELETTKIMKETEFQVGDRVEAISPPDSCHDLVGKKGTVRYIRDVYNCKIGVEFDESFAVGHTLDGKIKADMGRWCEASSLKKIGTKKSFMKKLTTIFKKLVDADTAALVQAGYLNEDLELTSDGASELQTISFIANKAALVDAAKAKLAEEATK